MKLSELTEEALLCMTAEQKWQLVCGKVRDDGDSAVVAILLGSRPSYARERALAAAELYRAGSFSVTFSSAVEDVSKLSAGALLSVAGAPHAQSNSKTANNR